MTWTPYAEISLRPTCLSGDGSTAGGDKDNQPALWSQARGETTLTTPPNAKDGCVTGLSEDGSVAVGFLVIANSLNLCVWKKGQVEFHAPISDEYPSVSRDGSTVVGDVLITRPGKASVTRAFRWTQNLGMEILSDQNLKDESFHATGCSADGSEIVGGLDSWNKIGSWRRGTQSIQPCIWLKGSLRIISDRPDGDGWYFVSCSENGDQILGLNGWGIPIMYKNDAAQPLPVYLARELRFGGVKEARLGGRNPRCSFREQKVYESLSMVLGPAAPGDDFSSAVQLGLSGQARYLTSSGGIDRESSAAGSRVNEVVGVSDDGTVILGCEDGSPPRYYLYRAPAKSDK